jgi:hypothetical protein
MLYMKGTVTIKVMKAACNSKNKVISLNIGELTRPVLAFNEANWGAEMQEYTKAAMNMNKMQFYEIMEKASEIMRTKSMPSNHCLNEPTTQFIPAGTQASLVDHYGDQDGGNDSGDISTNGEDGKLNQPHKTTGS